MSETQEFLIPWVAVENEQVRDGLVKELEREVTPEHKLWAVKTKAIARRVDADDVLFEIQSGSGGFADVHLTWRGKPEIDGSWPRAGLFSTFKEWVEKCMTPDHIHYAGEEEA